MNTITLQLNVEETNQLLALLGDQPIKSGLATLTTKIKAQGDMQLAKAAVENEAVNEAAEAVDVEVVS